jgi:glycosyltransferase involved in cell wall biosynthesis
MNPILNVLRPGAFGDVVMTSCVTSAMKKQGFEVHYYTIHTELAHLLDGVDKVFSPALWDQRAKGRDYIARFSDRNQSGQYFIDTICAEVELPRGKKMKLREFPKPLPYRYITLQRKPGWSSLKAYPHWDAVIRELPLPVVELDESRSWSETCALIQHASLHLGIDSVCSHIAAAYCTPAVVVFGSTSPAVSGHPTAVNLSVGPSKCHPCFIEDSYVNGHRFGEACPIDGCSQFVPHERVTQIAKNILTVKLSICMIVKNEEACIAACLESVKEADEIVVLDTGSIDGTESVVAALNLPNVRFIKDAYQWCDDFAHARNAALEYCTGDWILNIDADETLTPGSMATLRAAIAQVKGRTLRLNVKSSGGGSTHQFVRAFRRGVKYVGAAHESPDANDGEECEAEIVYGYSPAHDLDPDRMLRILTKEHAQRPDNARTLYYLAREFYYRKMWPQAIEFFEECVKRSSHLAERADAYLYLARICWQIQRGDEARTACMNAITINANFREALLFMATLSFEHNAVRWREFAEHATNERVLFVRTC